MKGYWLILGTDVADQAAQEEYAKLWAPIAERYEAKLIKGSDGPELKESRDTTRILLVEFPSYSAAKACYEDPAYQKARQYAGKASRRELVMFEGEISWLH